MFYRKSIPQNTSRQFSFYTKYDRMGIRYLSLLLFCIIVSCNQNEITYPERKTLIETVYASGKVIAGNEHMIQAASNGTIVEKLFHVGDTVHTGELLYIISREIPTVKVLSKDKNTPYENLTKLYLQVSGTSSSDSKSLIRSDCDCIVYQSGKETGESVRTLETLVILGSNAGHLARLSVDQQDISKVKIGQIVLVRTEITGDSIYEALVDKIYPMMNEANQTFNVDVIFKVPIHMPFIHYAVEGNIVIRKKENVLVLPVLALLEGDSVMIQTKRTQKKLKIETGIIGMDFIEIIKGIDETTPVLANFIK